MYQGGFREVANYDDSHVIPAARTLCSDCSILALPELWFPGPRDIRLQDGSKCLGFANKLDSDGDDSDEADDQDLGTTEVAGGQNDHSNDEGRMDNCQPLIGRHDLGPGHSEDHLETDIFTCHDTLPDLPVLELSAKEGKGCDMCAFLRTAILDDMASKGQEHALQGAESSPVEVVLRLFWGINREWTNTSGFVCGELQYWQGIWERRCGRILLSVESNDEDVVQNDSSSGVRTSESSDCPGARTWLRTDDLVCSCPLCPRNVSKLKYLLQKDVLQPSGLQRHQNLEQEQLHKTEGLHFLPTRLIDLGASPESIPRLIVTSESSEDYKRSGFRYATLSYCWGPPGDALKQFKLTAFNFRALRSGIPLEQITPVARDAIMVCRALDIRYLWIDALCIIQGDRQDWAKESASMAYVYGYSFLTICPIASNSCQEGFLENRNADSRIRIQTYRGIDGPESLEEDDVSGSLKPAGTYYFIRRQPALQPVYKILPRLNPRDLDNLKQCKWRSRGWCFQENVLSRRRLYFGNKMVHFETNKIFWSQNDLTVPTDISQAGLPYFESISPHLLRDLWWTKIRQDVIGREWTYSSDLLPSIAGFAKLCADRLQDHYVCGNWESQLFRSILFAREGAELASSSIGARMEELRHRKHFIAPSWCWASDITRFSFVPRAFGVFPARHRIHMDPAFVNLTPCMEYLEGPETTFGRVHHASYLELTTRFLAVAGPLEMIRSMVTDPLDESFDTDRSVARGDGIYFNFDWNRQNGESFMLTEDQQDRGELVIALVASTCTAHDGSSTANLVCAGLDILDELPREGCEYCSEGQSKELLLEKSNRNAWGLLLYRETNPKYNDDATDDHFYRVGIFFSLANEGHGVKKFENAGKKMFRIK